MTKTQLIDYLRVCADLADKPGDGVAHVGVEDLRHVIALLSDEPGASRTIEMWTAWSDSFGFVGNSIGVHEQRDLVEARIAKSMESPQAVKDLRPVRVTIHLDGPPLNRGAGQ